MKPWQPYKLTFCPIDFYNDDGRTLNKQGNRFMFACCVVDGFLKQMTTGRIC